MAALLIAYTVYTDSVFAVSSVASQLFVAEIRPGTCVKHELSARHHRGM